MMGMNETDLIARMAEAVAKHITPAIPIDIDLWDVAKIGAYLKRDAGTVRERLACRPDFPKAIRLPSATKHGGQPLYKAHEVIRWAESYQEKN